MCFRPGNVQKPKKCPQCGTVNAATAAVCSKCGEKLEAQKPQK